MNLPHGSPATRPSISVWSIHTCPSWCCRSMQASRKWMKALIGPAADLGCPRWRAFWLVTLPLSLSGVIAGVLLCFIPIVGEFVIPDLLGSSQSMMIGQTLWTEFFLNKDWPVASSIAIVLLAVLLTPILFYQRMQTRDLSERA